MLLFLFLPAPARAQEGFEPIVTGLGFAVNVAFAPDGTMFVAEKDIGAILIVRNGQVAPEYFASVDADTRVNETGLLGLALHPDFPDEPWVYAYYSDAGDQRNHLVRFLADGDVAVQRQTLLDLLPTTNGWHNGGDLTFGPDGMLYVSVGEGHDAPQAQDPSALGGRILRLEPDGSIPVDNPFGAGNPTFALGIRNSFGLCVDGRAGELWETENGPSGWDEINRIEPGGNYGWPAHLGPGGGPAFVEPVLAFEETIVPTGCAGSAYAGGLYFGEGYTGNLHRMVISGPGKAPRDTVIATFEGGITDVALDPTGALILVTPNAIYRGLGGVVGAPATTSGVSMRPTPSPSPSTGGPFAALGTGVGLLVAVVLAAFILWYRGRANR